MTTSTTPIPAPVRWGILATGRIAHTFVADLLLVPDARLSAVGSRRPEAAAAFATTYESQAGAPVRAHGSYEDLVADPEVDVVYVASPHSHHLEHARLALEAGKHVLCEKPLTLNLAQAEELVATARAHDRFLMEAMWTATHPVVRAVRADLHAGRFGLPRHLHAELGFVVDDSAPARLVDPALGGGALLDMGIYPLAIAHLMLGEADSLVAQADLRSGTGGRYDADVAIAGRHHGGALSTLTASLTSWSSRTASIATDLGRVDLADFHHPTRATFTAHDGTVTELVGSEPVIGRGYGNEIAEVNRCVRAGLRESPAVPLDFSLALTRQLDTLRTQLDLHYPVE